MGLWPCLVRNLGDMSGFSRTTEVNHSGTPSANDVSLNVVTADLNVYKRRWLYRFQSVISHFQRPSTSVPMLSLRALVAVIATASLSSNVVAQDTIPNYGLCGGKMFQGQTPHPCADGWICVAFSENQRYRSGAFHETNILLHYQMNSISTYCGSHNVP